MAVTGFTDADYLTRASGLGPVAKPFLVHAWCFRETGAGSEVALSLGQGITQGDHFFRINTSATQTLIVERDTAGANAITSAPPEDIWFGHTGGFVASNLREVWLDGANKNASATSRTPNAPIVTLIGRDQNNGSPWVTGALAEMTVWDLTGFSEANRNAFAILLGDASGGNVANPLALDAQAGQPWTGALVAYWRLETHTDTNDLSGNGHHLSTVGTLSTFGSHPPVDPVPAQALNHSHLALLGVG